MHFNVTALYRISMVMDELIGDIILFVLVWNKQTK